MKSIIKRITYTEFTDLSGYIIKHMCYWCITYSTGKTKEVKTTKVECLPKTAQNYLREARVIGTMQGFYCESAYTTTTTYRKECSE